METQCSTVPNFYLQWNMLHWKVLFCPNFVGGGSNCCHPMSKEEVEGRNQRCGQCVKCLLSRQVWHLTEVSGCGKPNRRTKAPWVPSKELQMYLSVQSCVGLKQHWRAAMLSMHCGISYLKSYLKFYNNIRSLGWFQRQCYTDFL